MKTTSETFKNGLKNRPEQLGMNKQKTLLAQISFERRTANRMLGMEKLLLLLQHEAWCFFELAEVVGNWVWIQFDELQPSTVAAALSELGFHWNIRH